jgi:hypothetical protein
MEIMLKKRILIVSGSFYPENSPRSFRTTELAKEFARSGHDVTVLLPEKNYDYSDFTKNYSLYIRYIGKTTFPSIEGPFKGFYGKMRRGFRRLLQLLFEYPSIELMPMVKKALKTENGYDLLISIAVPYPIHWGVAWARSDKNRIASTWVADCGDPYMGCKTDSFKKLFYFKYLEKWFCRKADFITIPNIDHLSQYYHEFHNKFKIVPQGFKFEDSNIYRGEIKNNVPTFAFAGVLLKVKRDPAPFLEYLTKVSNNFQFVLYTQSLHLIERYINILGNKILVKSYIPREDLLFELSKMDFLINIEFHSTVLSNSPSKLIDYLITGRPVLSLNMEKLDTSLIDEFLSGNYARRLRLTGTERFRIENVAAQFIELENRTIS